MPSFRRSRTLVSALSVAVLLTACGDDDELTDPDVVELLNTNVTLTVGVTCDDDGVTKSFTGTAGTTIVVTATGPLTLTPQFTLYAPDFETQLGGSASTGAGKASLTKALTESGVYNVVVCDANAVGGSLSLVVRQQ